MEVRIRRMVQSISKGGDGLFSVRVDHWEPSTYVDSSAQDPLGSYFGGVNEGGPWQDYPQLKKAEQKVSVADMKVGGSGSMRAMDGKVVEQETIKARYVVNAAGGQPEP